MLSLSATGRGPLLCDSTGYCYADAWLVLDQASRIEWTRRSHQRFTDATGTEDLGNIDHLRHVGDHWTINGDWGEVRVHTAAEPRLMLV